MTTLRDQLIAALSGATAQSPIDTETLVVGHVKSRVKAELQMMYANRMVSTCTIRKPGKLVQDVWWLTGNTETKKYCSGKRALTVKRQGVGEAGVTE